MDFAKWGGGGKLVVKKKFKNYFKLSLLTLYIPLMTKTEFLLTPSV